MHDALTAANGSLPAEAQRTDPQPGQPPQAQPVTLTCADGVTLQGHFLPAGGLVSPRLPVLLSPATGVRQHFYLRFAAWLADQGHDVLVFDYRGIGLSLQGRLRDSEARLQDWGQLDQVAALEWLAQRTGQEQAVLLGHSAGGQMLGLLPNHHRVARLVGVAASTGWFRGMRPAFRMRARFGLRCLIPLGTLVKGYGPCSLVGLGEDLPAGVARQWGQWCAAGGYATNAVRGQPARDFHAAIRIPVTLLHASDDDIATPATVGDLLRTLPHAQSRARCITPAELGLKALGHIDWFRASHRAVWPLLAAAVRGEG